MCTAITYNSSDFYFGRTLDYEFSYGEQIVITPRRFKFPFSNKKQYAIIGMAHVHNDYPLYYDAMNEQGLCMAGLNFVGSAYYFDDMYAKDNVAQFELIPWILTQCGSVDEVVEKCKNINITPSRISKKLPVAYLHWIIADKTRAITLEPTREGVKIYENNVGVLTNNPPFDMQMMFLNNFINLSPQPP
ncbi:MAG: linear amide C-N hydrolase, partial [Clostridia bacterium]|nr:linear amide C-N hydrolase [Clostridia bacterium]